MGGSSGGSSSSALAGSFLRDLRGRDGGAGERAGAIGWRRCGNSTPRKPGQTKKFQMPRLAAYPPPMTDHRHRNHRKFLAEGLA